MAHRLRSRTRSGGGSAVSISLSGTVQVGAWPNLTVSSVSNTNLSAGVFGIAVSSDNVNFIAQSVAGAVSTQTITVDLSSLGLTQAGPTYVKPYANLDPLDGIGSRIYGSTFAMADIGGISLPYPGGGFTDKMTGAQNIQLGTTAGFTAMAATGEKRAFMGRLFINGRPGTTKTISSAGGKLSFRTGTTTWANATTTVDIGIQGLATGAASPVARPNDTFDVKATVIGGDGKIVTAAWNDVTMTTGTKTMSEGDQFAVVWSMTSRAGADSLPVQSQVNGVSTSMPGAQLFTGAAWGATLVTASGPNVLITFDDGTLGCIDCSGVMTSTTTDTWVETDVPDERGNVLQSPIPIIIDGYWFMGGVTDQNSGGTISLYSAPTTAATLVTGSAVVLDPHMFAGASQDRMYCVKLPSPITLSANTDYCVAIHSTGSSNFRLNNFTVAAAAHKFWFGNGTSSKATRDGGAGNFSTANTVVYCIGFTMSGAVYTP